MIMNTELCVFMSHVEDLADTESLFGLVPEDSLEKMKDLIGREAVTNQSSVKTLKKIFGDDLIGAVRRLYFGQETCERLIPSPEDILKAARICAERKWGLSLVLPYVGPPGARTIKGLVPVISEASEILGQVEVVVQDFAGLMIISDLKNPNIIPVLGRLFTRMKRDPRFSVDEFVIDKNAYKAPDLDALRRTSFEGSSYTSFLNSLGVHRFSIEALPQGVDISRVSDLSADLYWPWVYVVSGRACKTAGLSDPCRARYPKESPCHMECRRMQINSPDSLLYSLTKGNAVWMECLKMNDISEGIGRLVYMPYIPV